MLALSRKIFSLFWVSVACLSAQNRVNSVVQHVGFNSLWGGPYIFAQDFDERWTAPE